MDIAEVVAKRGSCDRLQVGAVLVDSLTNRILSTGYNGSVPGAPTCEHVGHYMVDGHCKRTIHAERNAIAHAARHGVRVEGGWMYVTHAPCIDCAVLMAAAGLVGCTYRHDYRTPDYGSLRDVLHNFSVLRLMDDGSSVAVSWVNSKVLNGFKLGKP